jgi:predicted ATPase
MSKIKIKNFGPIKKGLPSNNGFIDIKQLTIFIGNQATGKSTIVKIYSTFVWLEKILYRGNIKESYIKRYNRFVKEFCAYQGLKNYFNDDTYLEYIGDVYSFIYSDKQLEIKKLNNNYLPPKIMYVPAERNFLSLVDNPEKLKQLPKPLYTFLEEFEEAKKNIDEINLPINNLKFEFQKQNKKSYISGENYKISLSEASSGIQSLLPVYLVSKYLSASINKEDDKSKKQLSVEKYIMLKKELEKIISNNKLTSELKDAALEILSATYKNSCFINIVEELEQNLFPESQKDLLYSLLEFSNLNIGNKLILTTHSPYIINYLTLSIKGKAILNRIQNNDILKNKLSNILPISSCIDGKNSIVYELDNNGSLKILSTYNELPSDNNYLNNFLDATNDSFDKLLDIEELI